MIFGVPHYEPWTVYVNIHTMVYIVEGALVKKNHYQNEDRLYNTRI